MALSRPETHTHEMDRESGDIRSVPKPPVAKETTAGSKKTNSSAESLP